MKLDENLSEISLITRDADLDVRPHDAERAGAAERGGAPLSLQVKRALITADLLERLENC